MTRQLVPVVDRILGRVTVTPFGCWEFTGATTNGYGVVGLGGRSAGTAQCHRVMYRELVGPVPEGLDLDHLCRNHLCCNPEHLEPVTRRENVRRGRRRPGYALAETHCKRGHEFVPENTKTNSSTGGRICRACNRATGYLGQRRRLQGESYSPSDVAALANTYYQQYRS